MMTAITTLPQKKRDLPAFCSSSSESLAAWSNPEESAITTQVNPKVHIGDFRNAHINQYVFCGANPVMFRDPSGLCKNKGFVRRALSLIKAPIWWLLNDVSAANTGIQGVLWGAAKLDPNAIVPRYDFHGGPNWPYADIDRDAPFTALGQAFYVHDQRYRVAVPEGQMSVGQADVELVGNMWTLGITEQPGPIGQAYRILATVAFGAKIAAWDSWHDN